MIFGWGGTISQLRNVSVIDVASDERPIMLLFRKTVNGRLRLPKSFRPLSGKNPENNSRNPSPKNPEKEKEEEESNRHNFWEVLNFSDFPLILGIFLFLGFYNRYGFIWGEPGKSP